MVDDWAPSGAGVGGKVLLPAPVAPFPGGRAPRLVSAPERPVKAA